MKDHDGIQLNWIPRIQVDKYDDEGNFIESIIDEGNLITTAGKTALAAAIVGTTPLSNTKTRLGVGDNTAAAAVGDTDLSTGANKYYRVMESTFPSSASAVMSFKSVFGPSDANFAWQCWGVDVTSGTASSGSSPNTLVNRKVFSFGTKSGGTWTVTVTISIT